jgi:hypothetical protein
MPAWLSGNFVESGRVGAWQKYDNDLTGAINQWLALVQCDN